MNSINDVFTWLNEFQGSTLTRTDTILRDAIRERITEGRFFQAYQVIEFLKSYENNRINAFERGEIWVECGLAFYDMENSVEGIKSLERAKSEYPPESHQHAVVGWMLGAIQWKIETKNVEAVKNWKSSIREFIELANEAEKKNKRTEKNWYSGKILEMEAALTSALTGTFP